MTKKILAVLLALTMLFAFAACGSSDKEIVTNGNDVVGKVDNSTDEKTESKKVESEEKKEEEDFVDDMGTGTSTGKTYNNKALGISYTIPDDFVVLSQDQIKKIYSNAVSVADLEKSSALTDSSVYYDFVAADINNNVVAIAFKKAPAKVTSSFIDTLVNQVGKQIEDSYKSVGATLDKFDTVTKKIGSATYKGISVDSSNNGNKIQQIQLYTGAGEYFAYIVVSAYNDTYTTDELLANFSNL